MIVADVLSILFFHLGLLLVIPAYWLVMRAIFPRHLETMERNYRTRPFVTFFTGVGVALGLVFVTAMLGAVPAQPIKVIALLFGFGSLGFSLAGAGGLVAHIGGRLRGARDEAEPWRATVRGGLAAMLSCMIPVLGWFILLPILLVSGVGASVLAIFGTSRAPEKPAPHPEVTAVPAENVPMAQVMS